MDKTKLRELVGLLDRVLKQGRSGSIVLAAMLVREELIALLAEGLADEA